MRHFVLTLPVFLAIAASTRAPCEESPVTPVARPSSHYTAEWENSAFHREVIPPQPTLEIRAGFAQYLTLDGLVEDDVEGPIAFVRNTEENLYLMITRERKPGVPFRIVEANQTHNPVTTTVRITNGTEEATIGFDRNRLVQSLSAPPAAAAKEESSPGATTSPPGDSERSSRGTTNEPPADEAERISPGEGEELTPEDRLENRTRQRKVPRPTETR